MDTVTSPYIAQRLARYNEVKVSHKLLKEALASALFYLTRSVSTDIVNLVGPTGIGKTMLLEQLEAQVLLRFQSEMDANPDVRPIIRSLAVASGFRQFDWKLLYMSGLMQLGDPFAHLRNQPGSAAARMALQAELDHRRNTTSVLRDRLETELRLRTTRIWGIDEAQHAVFGGKAGRPGDQFDVFKSLAQRTKTKLLLLGPEQLEAHLLTSAQLARRSVTVHFNRYHFDRQDEADEFASICACFLHGMELRGVPQVDQETLGLLYQGTLGCVGILKNWMERALAHCLERHSDPEQASLVLDDLCATRLSLKAMRSISADIHRFEAAQIENESDDSYDELLSPEGGRPGRAGVPSTSLPAPESKPRRGRPRVGVRNPGRDPVGGNELWGAS
jgi:hypothetical protein